MAVQLVNSLSFCQLFVCLFVYLFVCLFVYLFICSFVHLFICSFFHFFVFSFFHFFIFSFFHLFICLFVCLFVCLFICLCIHLLSLEMLLWNLNRSFVSISVDSDKIYFSFLSFSTFKKIWFSSQVLFYSVVKNVEIDLVGHLELT